MLFKKLSIPPTYGLKEIYQAPPLLPNVRDSTTTRSSKRKVVMRMRYFMGGVEMPRRSLPSVRWAQLELERQLKAEDCWRGLFDSKRIACEARGFGGMPPWPSL